MDLKQLNKKNICLLGLGIENYALAQYLFSKKINCQLTVADARSQAVLRKNYPKTKKVNWQTGKKYDHKIDSFDYIFRSPGYPLFNKNLKKIPEAKIYSPISFFLDLAPTKNIIGVTGTKGKGTTASLIYQIIKKSKKRSFLGGNIGIAPFDFLSKIKKTDWVVLELSSFHLEDLKRSPQIAVITNLYPEHLAPADPVNPNYHRSLADYKNAKLNITKYQSKNNFLVANVSIKNKLKLKKIKAKKIFFSKSNLDSQLIGEHNKENIAAAFEVAKILKIKNETIKKAVQSFKGLEHRLEYVKTASGVKYYNDSFATTPESTIIALNSFFQPIVLLAGGADKKSNFKKLSRLIKQKTTYVILLNGKATPRLKKELLKINYPKNKITTVYNIKQAVKLASAKAQKNEIVLLSTACASFGMFKNYKERGKLFKAEVNKIK